jgi:hypothetical protein
MIGVVLVAGVLVGAIVGWAVAAWRNARTDAPALEQQLDLERKTQIVRRRKKRDSREVLWFRRMTNPSIHKIYKDTYEFGGNDSAVKPSKGNNQL